MNQGLTTELPAADFGFIRYGQVWEDADILLEALDVQPGDSVLSIASAGDNALALLSRSPKHLLAVDLNPAQIACLELRTAALRELAHPDLLALIQGGPHNLAHYGKCRHHMGNQARDFWDARPKIIREGIGRAGKFERYFSLFRRFALPCVHGKRTVTALLQPRPRQDRLAFHERRWNTLRWRTLFHLFFSRFFMGRMGRDPEFFRYVDGPVSDRILTRTRHALTELDPSANPYLQWILLGHFGTALPFWLRPENLERIRENLDRLEWRQCGVADALDPHHPFQKWNLSDIFEYLSADATDHLLERIANASTRGGRLVYWNMLAPRSRPEKLSHRLAPESERANTLFPRDKAFFYSRLVIERVL